METVAVYSEDPVLTYRLQAEPGYVLLSVDCPARDLELMAGALTDCRPPILMTQLGAGMSPDRAEISLCLKWDQAPRLESLLVRAGFPAPASAREATLIHLQGPHYGDRYGILARALTGLSRAKVEPLAFAAAVHSLFILVEPADGKNALAGLARHFAPAE
jgi:aspartokinase